MPHPCPHHCPPSGDGPGRIVIVIVGILALGVAAGPAVHAVTDVLEVAAVVLAVVLGLVMLAVGGLVGVWVHRRPARVIRVDRPAVLHRHARALPAPERRAIAAPEYHRPSAPAASEARIRAGQAAAVGGTEHHGNRAGTAVADAIISEHPPTVQVSYSDYPAGDQLHR